MKQFILHNSCIQSVRFFFPHVTSLALLMAVDLFSFFVIMIVSLNILHIAPSAVFDCREEERSSQSSQTP